MITDTISHEEAVIQHFMEDPELAEIMLEEAIAEGDIEEEQKIRHRIVEAKARLSDRSYWGELVKKAEATAKNGYNLKATVVLVSRALDILKAALPVEA